MGCGDRYDETDVVAATTWEKMTNNEKSIYEKVQTQWGQGKLKYIRGSIRARKIKPDEDAIPFYDIAKLVRTTNEVNMRSTDISSDTNTQQKYEKYKFSSIDPTWYYKFIDPQGENFNKKELITPTGFKKEVVQEPIKEKNQPKVIKNVKKTKSYTINDLLPKSEYTNVKRYIRDCDEAKRILDQVVAAGRPLTYSDFNEIKERSLYCKTILLTEE